MKKETRLLLRMDSALHAKIKKLAKQSKRSLNSQIEVMLIDRLYQIEQAQKWEGEAVKK